MAYYSRIFFQVYLFFGLSLTYTNSHYFGKLYEPITTSPEVNTTTEHPLENSKIKIKVYYETLCPASVDFLTTQLQPLVEKLASHLEVQLVPYGHAKTWRLRGRYQFRCQHGPAECYGNKIHACSIDALQNTTQATLFNACLMQHSTYRAGVGYDYVSAMNWCGFKLNTLIHGIWQCVNSERGSVLLKGYGDDTHAIHPRYVPYVVLNDSTEKQDLYTSNLMATVCSMLPDEAATNCYKRY